MNGGRIAVLGAGPVGLEAALALRLVGWDVEVFERDSVGGNLERWGHVSLFSSFSLNHSKRGEWLLEEEGVELPARDSYLSGFEHRDRYLRPLARSEPLRGRVHEGMEVVSVGRDGIGKNSFLGGERAHHPFRLLVQDASGDERVHSAEIVVDCTGTYGRGNANWMGNGGLPARGERRLRQCESAKIHYELVDVAGAHRDRFEGRRVLVVGSGHSAATALRDLLSLPGTSVDWIARQGELPEPIPFDPLPERERLSRLAAELTRGADARVRFHPETTVEAIADAPGGLRVEVRSPAGEERLEVSEILAHVGYHPDNGIYRELQVHECYASGAPMKLAAALLGGSEGSADCLTQSSKGKETLLNPEPGFFILGAKSYGRNSNFLIRVGLEQIDDLLELLAPGARESKIS